MAFSGMGVLAVSHFPRSNGLTAPQQPTNEKYHILSHFDNHQNIATG
jgi:hypothetical protein